MKPRDTDIPVGPKWLHRCAFDGCPATSEQPSLDGWVFFGSGYPGLRRGDYCKAHGDAIKALDEAGGFDEEFDGHEEDEP